MPLVDVDQIIHGKTSIGCLLQPHGVAQHQRQNSAAVLGPDGVGAELKVDK